MATIVVASILVSVIIPVGTTVLLGAVPYEKIHVSFPGFDVAVATTVLTMAADLGALTSIGALVHLLFLRAERAARASFIGESLEVRMLRVASGVWAASAILLVAAEALDANGIILSRLTEPGAFPILLDASDTTKAWLINAVAAGVVFFASFFVDTWTGMLVPLVASAVGVLAPVVTGQVLVGPNHDFGGDAAVFQTLAVYGGFGPLLIATIGVASGQRIPPASLRRLLSLLLFMVPVVVVTDLVQAWFKLAGTGITDSLTGWLIIARWVALTLIALTLFCLRRLWKQARVRANHIAAAFAVSMLAIALWMSVTVAMTRQPPPQYFVPTSIQQVFMGFEVSGPPTPLNLITQWRPNLLFVSISAAAVITYLIGVHVLRRRGDLWPVGRTVAWLGGWSVVVIVTSSGLGKYSAPDFGVHMIVHMSLNMLAPGLLVLGGVVTLALRVSRSRRDEPAGLHDWLRWVLNWPLLRFLYNPLLVFIGFVGSYYALYLTPLFGEYMRFHWAHQLMNLHFLIIGYLYYSLVVGIDRPPRPLPHIGKLGYVLAAMPFHAFFGIVLMTSSVIVAENFYLYFDMPWADLPAQQYLGGGVAWAGGEIPLLLVVIALSVQWGRQDAREARRTDRHLDIRRDDEFEVYNEMLQRLAEREARQVTPLSDTVPTKEPSQ
ncbi:cytochrome c oxidase assembly protein [Microbacterium sp.]|uniref:cytochrome c oxidase assembly protein n=1 Tax=unclassified Microbacterium TaxID=2609290 RepID=UPI003A952287